MLTLKYVERKVFNDGEMTNFLADNEIQRWKYHFFELKNYKRDNEHIGCKTK